MSTSPFSLDAVRLAFECPMRWEKLARVASGQHPNGRDDERRFCHACNKHVHNLSAMTRAEAEALVRDDATPICVRVEVDAAGRSIHRPSAAAVLAGAVLVAGLGGCAPTADSDSSAGEAAVSEPGSAVIAEATPAGLADEPHVVMGEPPAVVSPPPAIMGGIRPVDTAPLGRVRRQVSPTE